MNSQALRAVLVALNAPRDSYCIGGEENEALCLVENYGCWRVFYSERGCHVEEQLFDAEESACIAFLERFQGMLRIDSSVSR